MRVVIIGAGVTGLAVAWKLSRDHEIVILEKNSQIGGVATTFRRGGFTLDTGPHKIYTLVPGILDEIKSLLGTEAITISKASGVIIAGKRLDYPIMFSDLLLRLNPLTSVRLGVGFGVAVLLSFLRRGEPVSYAQYFKRNFGVPAYNLVFRQLAEKSWGDPERITADFARRRVPYNGVFQMLKTMLFKDRKLSAEDFYYPRKGFVELSQIMLDKSLQNKGSIILNAEVKKFETEGDKVTAVTFSHEGRLKKISADYVVSTASLTALPSMFGAPPEVMVAASELKYRSLLLVYILVKKPKVTNDIWTFVPDRNFVFQRLSEQKNFNAEMGPEDSTVITAEVMCAANDAMWNASDEELYGKVIADLVKAGFVSQGEASGFYVIRMKNIYPVYELGYRQRVDRILRFTDQFDNFITLGRLGLFNYNNADHYVDMAIWAASHIRSRKPIRDWLPTRKRFDSYVIVD